MDEGGPTSLKQMYYEYLRVPGQAGGWWGRKAAKSCSPELTMGTTTNLITKMGQVLEGKAGVGSDGVWCLRGVGPAPVEVTPPHTGGTPGPQRFKTCPSRPGRSCVLKCETFDTRCQTTYLTESSFQRAHGPNKSHPQAVQDLAAMRNWETLLCCRM